MSDNLSDGFESSNSSNLFYKKKLISDIQPDDNLIQVLGIAIKLNAAQEFTLEDNGATIAIRNTPDDTPKIIEKGIYRVFGTYTIDPVGTHYLSAEIIQPITELNMKMYHQTMDLMKKIP
jgi:hypothetical protein